MTLLGLSVLVKPLLCAGPGVGCVHMYASLCGHKARRDVTVPILQARRMRLREVRWDVNQSLRDVLTIQAQHRGQGRAGRRQGHTHSAPHWGLGQLWPALGQQISLIRWRPLWLLAPVTGCLGMGAGLGVHTGTAASISCPPCCSGGGKQVGTRVGSSADP